MTRVLVAYATKMGGTKEIAEAIGDEFRRAQLAVVVANARDVANTDGFDALVLGSAVYTGRWRREAVRVLAQHADHEKAIPTWLFQSGPCGADAAKQLPAPQKVSRLAAMVGADPPVTFGGRLLQETAKGFLANKMAKGPLAGDFRDFERIRGWADDISVQLLAAHETEPR